MSETRKHRRSAEHPPVQVSQPTKKQKTSPPIEWKSCEAFWNTLSRIHLTKGALRELDRRNARYSPSRERRTARTSITKQESPTAADFLRRCGSRQAKELQRFARRGGPDLSSLEGYSEPVVPCPVMSSRLSTQRSGPNLTTKPATINTKSTGPYSRNFEQKLIDNGIFLDGYEYSDGIGEPEPANIGEIMEKLEQRRPSLSPSRFGKEEFRSFVRYDRNAKKEDEVRISVVPVIMGKVKDSRTISGGIPFGKLKSMVEVDENESGEKLTAPKPDIYHGARPEQLKKSIRQNLSSYIIPSTQEDLPIAPNHFFEVKGPGGSLSVALRQAGHDGAAGARAMHHIQSYGQDEVEHDNKAYTFSSIYHGGQLKMYAHHPGLSEEGKTEYYMNQVNTYAMTGNINGFRAGAAAYRNSVDLAAEHRNRLIARANAVLQACQSTSTASTGLDFSTSVARPEDTASETPAEDDEDDNNNNNDDDDDDDDDDPEMRPPRKGARASHPN